MKEKIIELFYMESYISDNGNMLYEKDFEDVADKIIQLIKSEIYTDVDYLAESMFKHFK